MRPQGVEGGEDGEDDDGFMVGPPPPDLLEESNAMPEDAREAEVRACMKAGEARTRMCACIYAVCVM